MRGTIANRRLRILLLLVQSAALLGVFYCYVALRIRPELFYLQRPHVFLFESYYFHDMVAHPGGLVEYLAAFLSPLMAWDWLGALLMTALVGLICWLMRGLFAAIGAGGGEIVYLLPAILVAMVLGQYIHPVQLCVGMSIALAGAGLYVRLGRFPIAVRIAAFAAGSVAMYFAAGGLYVVFACICGCYEWGVKRRYLLGAGWVLCATALPYAASWWPFDLVPGDAFRGMLTPSVEHWLAIPSSLPKALAFYWAVLVFPLIAVLLVAWRRKPVAEPPADTEEKEGGIPESPVGTPIGDWKIRLGLPLAVVSLLALADLATFDSAKRCLLEIECHNERQQWDEVLAWAERLPFPDARAYDPRILYCINRALFHKGELLDKLFAYPQVLSTPSLALVDADIDASANLNPRQCSEILFDLGRINESEQMTYEVIEKCGNRPEALKRLAYIYVIKGQPEAAKRFLLMLERSLLHHDWARRTGEQLEVDATLPDISLVAWGREASVRQDSVGDGGNLELMLARLLDRNPQNRMALEYLAAHYLLTRQPEKLAAICPGFKTLGYERLPRHVEEALACYMAMTKQFELDLGGWEIHSETWNRFADFIEAEQQLTGDKDRAFSELYPDFHDTYFFAFVFGHNLSSIGVARPAE